MNVALLLRRQGQLLTRTYDGAADELGDPTWQTVATPVACELQGSGSNESHEGAVQGSTWRLFLGPDAAALAGWDALELDGVVYELAGDPWPVYNPRVGAVDHVEALVVRVVEDVAA